MNLTYRQHIILLAALKVFEDATRDTAPPENKKELEELIDTVQEYTIMLKDKEMNGENTKLCKNCNWRYYRTGSGIHDRCLCPEIEQEQNPVTGEPIMNFCQFERLESGNCGPDAKYWIEKQPPEKFWNRLFNFGRK